MAKRQQHTAQPAPVAEPLLTPTELAPYLSVPIATRHSPSSRSKGSARETPAEHLEKMANNRKPAFELAVLPAEQRAWGPRHQAIDSEKSPTQGQATGPETRAGSGPLFLSVPAAAEALAVSDDTVYELLHRGELPCLRIGRRRVIPRRAVELVVEHLLDGFDPGQLAARLAAPTE